MDDQRRGPDDDPGTSVRPGRVGPPPGAYAAPPPPQPQPPSQQPPSQPHAQQQPAARPAQQPGWAPPAAQPWGPSYAAPTPPPAGRTPRDRRDRRGVGGLGLLAGALVIGGLAGMGGAALWSETTDPDNGRVDPSQIDTAGLDPLDLVSVQSVATAALPTVVKIEAVGGEGGSTGSGIVLSEDGEILTNYHVVHAGQSGDIEVFFHDGSTAEATVVGTDPDLDIALIRAEGVDDLETATLGDSRETTVGQAVVAVGSPYGLDATVTAGIISTLNRPVAVPSMDDPDLPMIYPALQTDAAINPGNSGGALVNIRGELIGVNSANKLAGSADPYGSADLGSIGIGWAIPIHVIEPILEQLRAGEAPTHAWLGIVPDDATEAGLPQGALVAGFASDSVAEEAGLETGDVITAMDDWQVSNGLGLGTTTLGFRPGDEVTLTVLRDGEEQEVEVTLGEKQRLFD